MIIDFTIENFRSYRDETTFTFEALENDFRDSNVSAIEVEGGKSIRLLKSAVILGANASGKSNIIWGLSALSSLILYSRTFDIEKKLSVYTPFLFEQGTRSKPIGMSINFIVKNIHYRYKIKYNSVILFERLYMINKDGKEEIVFEVQGDEKTKVRPVVVGSGWKNAKIDLPNVLANQLFLSVAGTIPDNQFLDIYSVLAGIQAEPIGNSFNLKNNNELIAATIVKNDKKLSSRLKKLMQVADLGIEDVILKEYSPQAFKFPDIIPDNLKESFIESNSWELNLIHKFYTNGKETGKINLPTRYASTGTITLLGVGARILNVLENGGLLAYDEINIALHPRLFKLLVSLFHDPLSNPHNAQLLFTTNDPSIVDESFLRADQIWFAEKEENGVSQLYSAQDFEDIKINMPFRNWYMAGRFGALPHFCGIENIFEDENQKKDQPK